MSKTGGSGWWKCCATPCLKKRASKSTTASLDRYAAEIAEHKRDPYSLVEEIVGKTGR